LYLERCIRSQQSEMGSGRVQPESDRLLARNFVTSDRSRQELPETRPWSGLDRARTHQCWAENGQVEVADRTDRVDCLRYPAEIERESIGISTWCNYTIVTWIAVFNHNWLSSRYNIPVSASPAVYLLHTIWLLLMAASPLPVAARPLLAAWHGGVSALSESTPAPSTIGALCHGTSALRIWQLPTGVSTGGRP